MAAPDLEVWYCWKEFSVPDGEIEPRLLGVWDPKISFRSAEEAKKWKEVLAPHEEWILCVQVTNPLRGWKMCPRCKETKEYDVDSPKYALCNDCSEDANDGEEHECPEDEVGGFRP